MVILIFLAHQRPVWDNGILLHLPNITILALNPIQGAVEVQDFCKIRALFLSLFHSYVWQLLLFILHRANTNTQCAVDQRLSLMIHYKLNPVIVT
jgi:hypothetical protein